MRFTARDNARAFIQRIGDVFLHFGDGFFIDQRPGGDVRLQTIAEVQFVHRLLELVGKLLIHAVLNVQTVGADAGLPGITKLRGQRTFHGFIKVGIVKDDKRRIAAQFQRYLFDVFGALLH